MEAFAKIEALPGSFEGQEAKEAEALAELADIKQQIDQLIFETNRRRKPVVDAIVVGTIETDGIDASPSAVDADVPRPGFRRKSVRLLSRSLVCSIVQRYSVALQKVHGTKGGKHCRSRNKQK